MKRLMMASLLVLSSTAFANCVVETYVSTDDLYNSQGVRLNNIGQIVRQSVANAEINECQLDEVGNRAKLQEAINHTRQPASIKRAIKKGDVFIRIVWRGNKAEVARVDRAVS